MPVISLFTRSKIWVWAQFDPKLIVLFWRDPEDWRSQAIRTGSHNSHQNTPISFSRWWYRLPSKCKTARNIEKEDRTEDRTPIHPQLGKDRKIRKESKLRLHPLYQLLTQSRGKPEVGGNLLALVHLYATRETNRPHTSLFLIVDDVVASLPVSALPCLALPTRYTYHLYHYYAIHSCNIQFSLINLPQKINTFLKFWIFWKIYKNYTSWILKILRNS